MGHSEGQLDEFVAAKIASERFKDVSQLVREALEVQQKDDAKTEAL